MLMNQIKKDVVVFNFDSGSKDIDVFNVINVSKKTLGKGEDKYTVITYTLNDGTKDIITFHAPKEV